MQSDSEAMVDLAFVISGRAVPLDHGYALFGALGSVWGDIHADEHLKVHPIDGLSNGEELLLDRESRLRVRVSASRIPAALKLAGKILRVNGHRLQVGVPSVYPLVPAPAIAARVVVIKLSGENPVADPVVARESFLSAVQKQLAALSVKADVQLGRRRVLRIRDNTVVGWAVRLSQLAEEASLLVQTAGLGGRQRFGCGVFSASREPLTVLEETEASHA